MDEIRKLFTVLMGWEGDDLMVVDAAFAAYVAIFLRGWIEPPWLGLVSAASTGKSATLDMFSECQTTEWVSNLSAKGLASGYRDDANPEFDPSTLARLQGGKVMLVHELTTMITKGQDEAKALFGTLRSAFDGKFSYASGKVGSVVYKDRFGFLFGCTSMIDEWILKNQQLGERSLLVRMPQLQGVAARKAGALATLKLSAQTKETLIREVKSRTAELVSKCKLREAPREIESLKEQFIDLGNVLTLARSVHHDGTVVDPEGLHRVRQQLEALCAGHCLVMGQSEWCETCLPMCRKVTRDMLHPEMMQVLRSIWRGSAAEAVNPIKSVQALALTAEGKQKFMQSQLMQWARVGVLQRLEAGTYGMHPDYAALCERTGFLS